MQKIPSHGVKWLFLDLNSYFASVEQQENPDLRKEPVAVVPMPTDATCAIAASYEAKAYGVKTGTKIYDAKKMCPSLKCVQARHHIYVRYHHRIVNEIVKHTPICKVWSVDELSSRLTRTNMRVENAISLSKRIKSGIHKNVGEAISCSIGLAPNSFLAKVATDMQKPDGLVVLEGKDLPGPLLDLELMDLPGINVNMLKRLNRGGVWSVEDLWNLPPKAARQIWGSVAGERFWYSLHGYELPDIKTSPRMIGHSRMLDPDMRHPDHARQMARRLTSKAVARLRRKGFYARFFRLSVRTIPYQRWAIEHDIRPAARDVSTFLETLEILWQRMLEDMAPQRLLKVSISLHGLSRQEDITGDLFCDIEETTRLQRQKRENISKAVEDINARFGHNALALGIPPKTIAGYVGTKIAFSRIPDEAEFSE